MIKHKSDWNGQFCWELSFESSRGCFLVHSLQPSFFSNTDRRVPWVSGGFLESRIPGKNGEGTPRRTPFQLSIGGVVDSWEANCT